jgi:ubiquinone/menaquinone biosynthesis C-methylase UbiE
MPHTLEVCPVWLGHILANPLRRLLQDPWRILAPYVEPGMTALDVGCAMGFFTFPLAWMVGPAGRVLAVDVQEEMLAALRRRARRRHLEARIETRLATETSFGLDNVSAVADFALLFAMVHEVADPPSLFPEMHRVLKPGGTALLAEPVAHVSRERFDATLSQARAAGFEVGDSPRIRLSLTALLKRV